jgi:hypothetical protein
VDISITTPAVLFPALTLLLLAYTNRFLALSSLIRKMHETYQANPSPVILPQLRNFRRRIVLIRNMQACGVASILCCGICMLLLFAGQTTAGHIAFAVALLLLVTSTILSLCEIWISVDALNHLLRDFAPDAGSPTK